MSRASRIKTHKSDSTASKLEPGSKRTCQHSECGAMFYDLVLTAPDPPAWTTRSHQKPVKKRKVAIDDIKPDAAAEGNELP